MTTTYADIKDYNVRPEFLREIAKNVILCLGWDIPQDPEANINVMITKAKDSPCSKISITFHKGSIAINCEYLPDFTLHGYAESQKRVNFFIKSLEDHVNNMMPAQIPKLHESIGDSLVLRKVIIHYP